MEDWKTFLEAFRLTIESSAERLHSITEERSGAGRAEDKWSPKEIVGHLIDSAANNHQRFVRGQFSENLTFPAYDQNQWIEAQQYRRESWLSLIELWRLYNLHLLHVMTSVDEQKLKKRHTMRSLNKIAREPVNEDESVTLEYVMRDYVVHLKHHLRQIFGEDV
ncbi:MAG TPA: DinB family protein [Pyrinomonadaceae bacterium]|nr:DinB family protein [Pyrinomonadaceae bacterium]